MNNGSSTNNSNNTLYKVILWSQFVTLLPLGLGLLHFQKTQLISLIGYLCMSIATLLLLRYAIKHHLKLNWVRTLFFIWVVYLYISAIPDIFNPDSNYINLKKFLTELMFMYAIPLFMIVEIDTVFLRKLFKFSYFLGIIYLFTVILGNGRSEWYTMLAEGLIILIMTWPYHSIKKNVVVIAAILVAIVFMMLAARRNKVVFYGGGLMFAVLINLFSANSFGFGRKLVLGILVLLMAFVLYLNMSSFGFFVERMGTGMESREGVITLFVSDFNSHPSDWVFGRGLYGQVEADFNATDEATGLRDGIENGYLFLILKGGGIWLGLLTLIALNAIFKGLFRSKNLLCKGFAMIILLYYLDMIGFGIPQTSLKYIMVFLAIAGCNTAWLRESSDQYLAQEIGLK